jgi:hypothetical protein
MDKPHDEDIVWRQAMSRDLRKYMRDTNVRLIAGALLLLFIVGDGLIWLIYGFGAAMMGLLCILASLVPVVLILLLLGLSDWIVKRANRD